VVPNQRKEWVELDLGEWGSGRSTP
jgi:hypothetical protein